MTILTGAKIFYADCDRQRLTAVSKVLASAGCRVWSCSGEMPLTPPSFDVPFDVPDLVLLCQALDDSLHALAVTLWPDVAILVLDDHPDFRQLPISIESTMQKRTDKR